MIRISDENRKQLLNLIEEWMEKQVVEDSISIHDCTEQTLQEQSARTMLQPANLKAVFSVKEVSDYLCVSPDCIYAMVREKQIPFVRIRRRILFHRDSIDRWLELNEFSSL